MFTLKNSTRGFTLIELLVVITIIGILATGATAAYTSSLSKARDTIRINDIMAIKSGIEQAYQDTSAYPAAGAGFSSVATFMPKMPKDPKSGQANTAAGGVSSLDYAYMSGPDANSIAGQEYEVSTGFEYVNNATSKGAGDSGNDAPRFETGIDIAANATNIVGVQALNTWVATPAAAPANGCVAAGGTSIAAGVACTTANVMIIR